MLYKSKSGTQYNLTNSPFKQGGEGFIYDVSGKPNIVAKLYKAGKNTPDKEQKLLSMVKHSPDKSVMSQIAWPLDILYDSHNAFVGFTMPKLAKNEDLNVIYEYGDKAKYQNVPWGNKIIIAKNLCVVLSAVHAVGHVVGDLNPKNISVDPNNGHIAFFDADSFHITEGGKVYRCDVGMPEYLPVEIQRKMKGGYKLSTAPLPTFTTYTDNFALAIHIFQLLMNGTHPFSCRVLPSQASVVFPQPVDNILNGDFPFVKAKSGTTIPVFAPPLDILPKELQELFKRAFISGHTNPSMRPTPEEWYKALCGLEKNLIQCNVVSSHQYYKGLSRCPWCEADRKYKATIMGASNIIAQSSFSQSLKPAYNPPVYSPTPAPQSSYGGSSAYRASYSGYRNRGKIKWFPVLYLILSMLSMIVCQILDVTNYIMLAVNAGELVLFFILFNCKLKLSDYGEEYHTVTIIFFTILAVAMAVLSIIYVDELLPNLQTIKAMIDNGQANLNYYNGLLSEVRVTAIIGTIVMVIAMILGIFIGEKNIPSVTLPLALIGAIILYMIILNFVAADQIPHSNEEVYDASFFLWTIIGSILTVIPSVIYLAIVYFVGNKAAGN